MKNEIQVCRGTGRAPLEVLEGKEQERKNLTCSGFSSKIRKDLLPSPFSAARMKYPKSRMEKECQNSPAKSIGKKFLPA